MYGKANRVIAWTFVDRLQRLFQRNPISTVSVPIFLGLAVHALLKEDSEWLGVYIATARVLLGGGDIYATGYGYLYPPFAALLAIPFAPLPDFAARLAWYLINVAAIVCLLRSAWSLAGGSQLRSIESMDRREWLVLGLGILCFGPYALNMLAHQQTDLVIAALLTMGCSTMLRGRMVVGAGLIGLAAAFKGPPLLFVGYLVFRRRWLAAGSVLVVAVGVNLLPDLIAHPQTGTWLSHWLSRIVLPAQDLNTPLGTWNADLYNFFNQSLAGTLQRLVNTTLIVNAGDLQVVARSAMVDAGTMKAIAYSSMLLMLVISIGAALYGERNMQQNASRPDLPSRSAIEFGIMMILVLLLSPMSGLAHFVVLATPILCLSRMAVSGRNHIAMIVTLMGVTGALLINKDLVGATVYELVGWSGVPTVSAIALWMGGIILLANGDGAPASPAFSISIFSWANRNYPRSVDER